MPLRITSGPAIQHAGDLAAILSSLDEGEVLFLDEIHRMARPAEEMLYLAMEDFRVDVVVGKGPGATAIPLEIPPFTWSAPPPGPGCCPARCATGSASPPTWTSTTPPSSTRSCTARPGCSASTPTTDGAAEIAGRSRGTPRIANRLLRRVRDFAQVRPTASSTSTRPRAALELYEVDELGLDRLDRAVLDALCRRFGGGPVGLSTLAVAVGEERETVEEVAEPFLVRAGLLARTPRGPGRHAARPGRTSGSRPRRPAPAAAALPLDGRRRRPAADPGESRAA